MDKRTTDIVAYLTWIGFVVALVAAKDKDASKFHVNQSLVIMLFSLLGLVPLVGWIWLIFMTVCWFMGFIGAINGEEKPIPLISEIKIIK